MANCAPLWAEPEAFDTTLSAYVAKMVLFLLLLGALGYLLVKFVPGKFRPGVQGKFAMIGAMQLGRDVLYVVRIGPDVVALLVGRTGSSVVGRWSASEWERSDEGGTGEPASDNSFAKDGE